MGIKEKLKQIDAMTEKGMQAADKNAIARDEKNTCLVAALLKHLSNDHLSKPA